MRPCAYQTMAAARRISWVNSFGERCNVAKASSGISIVRVATGVLLSGKDLAHDLAVDVGEAEVAAGIAVGEPGVVEAEQVQDRRMEVVDVDGLLDGPV